LDVLAKTPIGHFAAIAIVFANMARYILDAGTVRRNKEAVSKRPPISKNPYKGSDQSSYT